MKRRSFLKGLLTAIPAVAVAKIIPNIKPITLIEDHWNVRINKRYTFIKSARNMIYVKVAGQDYYIPVCDEEGAA